MKSNKLKLNPKNNTFAESQLLIIKKKLKDKETNSKFVKQKKFIIYNFVKRTNRMVIFRWINNRSLRMYDRYLRLMFKDKNIINFIENKFHNKKVIRVLDDGMGKGLFLSELKDNLNKKFKLITTGTTIDPYELKRNNINKNIDNIILQDTSQFRIKNNLLTVVPEIKQDLIVSLYGAYQYTLPEIRKEVLLKNAFLLNNGGYMFIVYSKSNYMINIKDQFDILFNRKKLEEPYILLKKEIEKHGFEFHHYFSVNMFAELISIKKI